MFNESDSRIKTALSLVISASRMARTIQGAMAVLKMTKPDLSPVTVADFAVQALVAHGLGEHFPGEGLVAEETAEHLAQEPDVLESVTHFVGRHVPGARPEDIIEWIERGAGTGTSSSRYWILDPIDGTKGYLRGGQYAVALALVEDGEVKLGMLGCPNLGAGCTLDICGEGQLVAAVRGEGSWECSLEEGAAFSPMRVSAQGDARQARLLRSHEAGHTNIDQINAFAHAMDIVAEPVLMDSQAKYAVLAAGHAEVMLRLLSPNQMDYREKVWDQAAGSIVIEEAGGQVTDLDGKALDFSTGRRLENNRGIVASNGVLHEQALAALNKIL